MEDTLTYPLQIVPEHYLGQRSIQALNIQLYSRAHIPHEQLATENTLPSYFNFEPDFE